MFTRPQPKERVNDKGDTLATLVDGHGEVRGGFVAAGEKNYRAAIRPDGSATGESSPFQGNIYHGLITVKSGEHRVYAAATKNGKPDVFFAAAESAADFRDAANTLRAAGLDPAEHLPHAAAHTFGTGKRSMLSRVHEYLRDGGVEPPAPVKGTPSDRDAMASAVAANPRDTAAKLALSDATQDDPTTTPTERYESHKAGPYAEALKRRDAASAKLQSLKRRAAGVWDNDSGLWTVEPETITPEQQAAAQAEYDLAAADFAAHAAESKRLFEAHMSHKYPKTGDKKTPTAAPVKLKGNTYAVRAELAKIPGAKYSAAKKTWTVPAEHAARAQQIVDGAPKSAPASDLLKLSDAELADRGLVRTSGPRGPYVRRGTPEELNDHL